MFVPTKPSSAGSSVIDATSTMSTHVTVTAAVP